MFENTKAYSGFAADDIPKAKQFYEGTLGLKVSVEEGGELLILHLPGDRNTLIYSKPDFTPATYTVLNFVVDDVEAAVDDLTSRGVSMKRYEGFEQDERGIAHPGNGGGPTIAWFTDPAGNILAVHDEM